jgi:hypothetical protein
MRADEHDRWPLDLKIFAALCVAWSVGLVVRVLTQGGLGSAADPAQAVVFGYKTYGLQARLVLLAQSSVYAFCGLGILGQKRWGLVAALLYMSQVVIGHLAFVLLNLQVPGQEIHVKIAAAEGPVMVLILLYLWIRSRDLLFEERDPEVTSPSR